MSIVCPIVFTCIGAVLIVLGGVLGWIVVPSVIEDQIIKNVVLENGSLQFERWKVVPFPTDFKVYLFNIENPEEVAAGRKPNLTEVGPYYYKQYRIKQNVTNVGGDLEYKQIQIFQFDEKKSAPLKDTDEITILNVPFNALVQMVNYKSPIYLAAINGFLNDIFSGKTDITLRTTVKEFLFDGVKICIEGNPKIPCDEIKKEASKTMQIDDDGTIRISLFGHKHNKDDGLYRVKTGKSNIKDLGKIVEWEGKDTVDFWLGGKNSTCNMINGTDNAIYAPFVKRENSLQVFNTDICRSVTTYYEKDVEYEGIKAFRFLGKENILPAPSKESNNDCFCVEETFGITQNDSNCLLDGVMELFPCFESHVVLSFPHFLMADETYRNGVYGMNPDPDLHQIFLDIEPNTGTPLKGGKRVQFNMFTRRFLTISTLRRLNTILIPFIWVDEGLDLPLKYVTELNESLFDILTIIDIVRWALIGVGCGLFIIFIIVIIYKKTRTATV